MAQQSLAIHSGGFVLVGGQNGVTLIPESTPLTRLNYFDGKFLRASDLESEQRYLRSLVAYSNKAGGHGVAHGFDVSDGPGNSLQIGKGLAVDAEGRVLLLPQSTFVDVQELVEKSRKVIDSQFQAGASGTGKFSDCVKVAENPPGNVVEMGDLYVITVAHAEALCGEEDVFGKLCEEACVTSTDRPYRIEGIVVRARPLSLLVPLPDSTIPLNQKHLRSRVASAYYASERLAVSHHISKAGLESEVWCFGARPDSGSEVPIAVVGLSGDSLQYLDAWTARRERIDPPAKRYWQWRMRMRPWDVYLAQILQFQCQLHDMFDDGRPSGGGDDPCDGARKLVVQASQMFAQVTEFYSRVASRLREFDVTGVPGGLTMLSKFGNDLKKAELTLGQQPSNRLLINGGIVELPSAGYLPVVPGSGVSVNKQVRAMMGEGVDLRFCIVRPDFVAHALEEAQHMERISLLQGIDDPENKPQVDILVPGGNIAKRTTASPGTGFEASFALAPERSDATADNIPAAAKYKGAARSTLLDTGGGAVYGAGAIRGKAMVEVFRVMSAMGGVARPMDETDFRVIERMSSQPDLMVVEDFQPTSNDLADIRRIAMLTARARGVRPGAAPDTAPPAIVNAGNAPAAAESVGAIWVSGTSARDPFQLKVGETTAVELRLIATMVSPRVVGTNLRVLGEFRLEQPVLHASGARKAVGRLTGVSSNNPPGGDRPNQESLNMEASVTHILGEDVFRISLLDPVKQNGIRFEVRWGESPLRVSMSAQMRSVDPNGEITERDWLASKLVENSDVLEPGNTSHSLALSAIDMIAAAIDDPGFADEAALELFPPPTAPSDELEVNATADWVLFHRRRTKQCGVEPEAVDIVTRRYQIYSILVGSRIDADVARKALAEGDEELIAKLGPVPVDFVDFRAGLPTITTSTAELQADWAGANPGNRLLYAAIGSQGAAAGEGATLAGHRLSNVVSALSAISAPIDATTLDTLPSLPAILSVPGTDGSVVLVTFQQADEQPLLSFRALAAAEVPTVSRINRGAAVGPYHFVSSGGQAGDELSVVVRLTPNVPIANGPSSPIILTAKSGPDGGVSTINGKASNDGRFVEFDPVVFTVGDRADFTISNIRVDTTKLPSNENTITAAASVTIQGQSATMADAAQVLANVAAQELAERTGRIFVFRGSPTDRVFTTLRPTQVVTFTVASSGDQIIGMTDPMIESLKRPSPYSSLELLMRDGSPDADASRRTKAIMKFLDELGLMAQGASVSPPATLTDRDRAVLPNTISDADDIIFLGIG